VHPFVPSVLLWVAWLDALDVNPESQPPHGKFCKSEKTVRGRERNAVVGADCTRQTVLLKHALKHRKRALDTDVFQSFDCEEKTTRVIRDRKWIAVATIAKHKLPFEIRAPKLIWPFTGTQRRSFGFISSPFTTLDESVPIKNSVNCVDRGYSETRELFCDQFPNLGCPELGLLFFQF
jgi:hypothetical protein